MFLLMFWQTLASARTLTYVYRVLHPDAPASELSGWLPPKLFDIYRFSLLHFSQCLTRSTSSAHTSMRTPQIIFYNDNSRKLNNNLNPCSNLWIVMIFYIIVYVIKLFLTMKTLSYNYVVSSVCTLKHSRWALKKKPTTNDCVLLRLMIGFVGILLKNLVSYYLM